MQTNIEKLNELIESILFVSGQGIDLKDIAEKLEIDKQQVLEAVDFLKQKHKDDGINIITYKNCVQMCSNPNFAEDIALVLNPIKEKLLTKAALETVAIIAYKQPVTRIDIEQVRGVNSDYALQVLLNFKLIEVVGRKDVVGKPLLFGTTDEFLKRFELQTINDLPDYDELIERIKVIHLNEKANEKLYGEAKILSEEEMSQSVENSIESDEDENNKMIESLLNQKDIIDNSDFGSDML